MQRLAQLEVSTADLDAILITHLHSDHVVGLADLLMTGWVVDRRNRPLRIYGPEGTRELLENLEQAFAFDISIRTTEAARDPSGATALVTEIEPGFVLELGELRVSAFDVDHAPIEPAFGYRIDARGRSAAISGDTRYSESLIDETRGVDLLIHEIVGASTEVLETRPNLPRVAHHTLPIDAARVFREVSPRLAVLSHIVLVDYPAEKLVPDIAEHWDGEVVLGQDLMRIAIGEEIHVGDAGPARNDLESLLKTRDTHRVAHRTENIELWLRSLADPILNVDSGEVSAVAREDFAARMRGYFDAVEFVGWEDLDPPKIRMASDGSTAEVIVKKRVDTVSGGVSASTTFAWTEGWRRIADAWFLESITSTRGERVSGEENGQALIDAIRRSRDWLGGPIVLEMAMTRFSAECQGPNGPYETSAFSARDGRFRFEQQRPAQPTFGFGQSLDGTWGRNADGEIVEMEIDGRLRHFAAGHEWPLIALAPESRYREPGYLGESSLDGVASEAIGWSDPLEGVVVFHYAPDGRPIGYVLDAHDGSETPIRTFFRDWTEIDGIKLPSRIEIVHGDEVFVCEMTDLETGWIPDREFLPINEDRP